MDKQGFREMYQACKSNGEQGETSLAVSECFDAFLDGKATGAESVTAFSRMLLEEGMYTEENYIALIRYCLFTKNLLMYMSRFGPVDGGESGNNLYRLVAERCGTAVRDRLFARMDVAPYGLPIPEKPAALQPVIERLDGE